MTPAHLTHGHPDDVADALDEGVDFRAASSYDMALRSALINALRRVAVLERVVRQLSDAHP